MTLYRIKQCITFGADLVLYTAGLWLALILRHRSLPDTHVFEQHVVFFVPVFILWVLLNYINGLYNLHHISSKEFTKRSIQTMLLSFAGATALFYLFSTSIKTLNPKTILLLTTILGYTLGHLWRISYQKILGQTKRGANVLFVGYTDEVRELVDLIHTYPEKGLRTAGILDTKTPNHTDIPQTIPVFHDITDLTDIIKEKNIKHVIVAPHLREEHLVTEELYKLVFLNVHVTDLASFYEINTGRIPPSTFSEGWFLDHLKNKDVTVYTKLRTIFDMIAIALLSIVFIVTLPLIALAIKLTSKGPVFYAQKRVGKNGMIFTLYKYRSMYALSSDGGAETNGAQFATKNDVRITPIGKFLRQTRLDELPQIINLITRDISLIGPRPERPEIVKTLTQEMPYYPIRHIVKPGLTGWAVLHQNYTDTFEKTLQKLQYDLYYIKNRSIFLDLSIILKTINLIIRGMGQ